MAHGEKAKGEQKADEESGIHRHRCTGNQGKRSKNSKMGRRGLGYACAQGLDSRHRTQVAPGPTRFPAWHYLYHVRLPKPPGELELALP